MGDSSLESQVELTEKIHQKNTPKKYTKKSN